MKTEIAQRLHAAANLLESEEHGAALLAIWRTGDGFDVRYAAVRAVCTALGINSLHTWSDGRDPVEVIDALRLTAWLLESEES